MNEFEKFLKENNYEDDLEFQLCDLEMAFKAGAEWNKMRMIDIVCKWIEETSHYASTNFNVGNFKNYIKNRC